MLADAFPLTDDLEASLFMQGEAGGVLREHRIATSTPGALRRGDAGCQQCSPDAATMVVG